MKYATMLCAAVVALSTAAFAKEQKSQFPKRASSDVEQQIRSTGSEYERLFNEKSWDKATQQYSANATWVTADGKLVQGRNQIRQELERGASQMPSDVQLKVAFSNIELLSPDLAVAEFRETLSRSATGGGGTQGQETQGSTTQGSTTQGGTMQGEQTQGSANVGTGGSGQQMQFPMNLEGVAVLQRVGGKWQAVSTHEFPSRELLRQQMGVGGAGQQMNQPPTDQQMQQEPTTPEPSR